jgi:hypothetical protein
MSMNACRSNYYLINSFYLRLCYSSIISIYCNPYRLSPVLKSTSIASCSIISSKLRIVLVIPDFFVDAKPPVGGKYDELDSI